MIELSPEMRQILIQTLIEALRELVKLVGQIVAHLGETVSSATASAAR